MVAIFVVALGVLAMAGVQMRSLADTVVSQQRTAATLQAQAIADMARSNMAGVTAGSYNNPVASVTAACLAAAGCTPAQMAATQLAMWNAANAQLLTGGVGTVCIDSTPNDGTPVDWMCDNVGSVYVVKVTWDESRDGTVRRFVTAFNP